MEYQEAPTANLNSTYEVSDNEDAEITRSLHASLLVQAPLQARFLPRTRLLLSAVRRGLPELQSSGLWVIVLKFCGHPQAG
jgi:hypothetical protein